jgi:hypothetical protein
MSGPELRPAVKMHSYFNPALMVSLEAPEGWTVEASDAVPLALFAPAEQNYRAHLDVRLAVLDPPTPERFRELIGEAYRGSLGDRLDDYRLVDDAEFLLDERPAYCACFEWYEPVLAFRFSQIDTLALEGAGRLYEVHGYSRAELADRYLPILRRIIASIRFIPPRP